MYAPTCVVKAAFFGAHKRIAMNVRRFGFGESSRVTSSTGVWLSGVDTFDTMSEKPARRLGVPPGVVGWLPGVVGWEGEGGSMGGMVMAMEGAGDSMWLSMNVEVALIQRQKA